MKTRMLLFLSLVPALGQGCDTHAAADEPSAACKVAEILAVGEATTAEQARAALAPGEDLNEALAELRGYGLGEVTHTFAASQVTYLWWTTSEAQDEALAAVCGP